MQWILKTLLILSFLFVSIPGWCLNAFVQPCVFYTPDYKPYAEIRIYIDHKGFIKTIQKDSTLAIKAYVTLLLKKGLEIKKVDKILIESPSGLELKPLIHQLRWAIEPGNYELETKIEDANDSLRELTLLNTFQVKPASQSTFLSGIQLSSISKAITDSNHILFKNGFYSEPLIYHQFNSGQNILYAYLESYKTEQLGNKYALKFSLYKKDSSGILSLKEDWYRSRNSNAIDPFLLKHDISSLTTGTYRLIVQILNSKSIKTDEQFIDFFRENPFWDKIEILNRSRKEDKQFFDTLSVDLINYSIRALYPIISSLDVAVLNDLYKQKKLEEKRVFLFAYWSERSDTAKKAFNTYLEYVRKIDELFYSGFGYGFETDRGVVYLRYGKPDDVIAEDKDNGAFPYEIWKYNKVSKTGQTNVKFLFYNPDLAGSDFRLLHSTAHGERQNKKWEIDLYKNAPGEEKGDNFFDATEIQSGYNRRAREYFEH
ncbi:MAG: GWxTD domain-containing protein [Saprospiraceae bacterium]|nr:GWxTD domain-containing protein [Saprospiraceae bacterium]